MWTVDLKVENGNHSTQLPVNLKGIPAGYYVLNVLFDNGSVSSLKLIK